MDIKIDDIKGLIRMIAYDYNKASKNQEKASIPCADVNEFYLGFVDGKRKEALSVLEDLEIKFGCFKTNVRMRTETIEIGEKEDIKYLAVINYPIVEVTFDDEQG